MEDNLPQLRRRRGSAEDPEDEITSLAAKQARKALAVAEGERFQHLYVLSLMRGSRVGEALALEWSDLDLDAGTLRVNR
jgi:integrase